MDLESDFPGLKADVNVFGDGLVCLGPIRPVAALLLAELIASGLAAETPDRVMATATERRPDVSAA